MLKSVLLIVYKLPCNLLQLLSLQSHSHDNSDVELAGVEYHPPPLVSLDELEEEQQEGSTRAPLTTPPSWESRRRRKKNLCV